MIKPFLLELGRGAPTTRRPIEAAAIDQPTLVEELPLCVATDSRAVLAHARTLKTEVNRETTDDR